MAPNRWRRTQPKVVPEFCEIDGVGAHGRGHESCVMAGDFARANGKVSPNAPVGCGRVESAVRRLARQPPCGGARTDIKSPNYGLPEGIAPPRGSRDTVPADIARHPVCCSTSSLPQCDWVRHPSERGSIRDFQIGRYPMPVLVLPANYPKVVQGCFASRGACPRLRRPSS
jgi:hypothetical protein